MLRSSVVEKQGKAIRSRRLDHHHVNGIRQNMLPVLTMFMPREQFVLGISLIHEQFKQTN